MIMDVQCSCIYSCEVHTYRTLWIHNTEQHVTDVVERKTGVRGRL